MTFLKGELAKKIYKGAAAGIALFGAGMAAAGLYENTEARRTNPHQDFTLTTAARLASDKAMEAKKADTIPAPHLF